MLFIYDAVNLSLNFKFKLLLLPNFQRSFSVTSATHFIGSAKVRGLFYSSKYFERKFQFILMVKSDLKNCYSISYRRYYLKKNVGNCLNEFPFLTNGRRRYESYFNHQIYLLKKMIFFRHSFQINLQRTSPFL